MLRSVYVKEASISSSRRATQCGKASARNILRPRKFRYITGEGWDKFTKIRFYQKLRFVILMLRRKKLNATLAPRNRNSLHNRQDIAATVQDAAALAAFSSLRWFFPAKCVARMAAFNTETLHRSHLKKRVFFADPYRFFQQIAAPPARRLPI
jgi:hypothetical protein